MVTLTLLFQTFLQATWLLCLLFLFDLTKKLFFEKNDGFESLDEYKEWIDEEQEIVDEYKSDYKRKLDAETKKKNGEK